MTDGFSRPLLVDGVYLDLPLHEYLADPALSGSAFKVLLTDPPAWRWERADNPLWERGETRFQARGTACHAAILEGLAAYEARFGVKPDRRDYPEALDTTDDLKAWLRERDGKTSGVKADLIARVLEIDPGAPIWSEIEERAIAGRAPLANADDVYVRLLEAFVRRDPDFAPLVADGLAEVTVIWTDETGQRLKARLDYLNAASVTDLKTFGRPPRRGQSLRQYVVSEVVANGYDIQAVHNTRAAQIALEMPLGREPSSLAAMAQRIGSRR